MTEEKFNRMRPQQPELNFDDASPQDFDALRKKAAAVPAEKVV